MKTISIEKITEAVSELTIQACYELPDDVLGALEKAKAAETSSRAKNVLAQLIENAEIAKTQRIPLCQDTGLSVVFIEKGTEITFEPAGCDLFNAVNLGVEIGYDKGSLRKSVVAEPMNLRRNTGTNTPCIIHYSQNNGDKLKISVMAKGGGCENKSQFKMFNPTESKDNICRWIAAVAKEAGASACPPFVVGVGIGGNFEKCCLLSKKSLLKKIGTKHKDPFYASMEDEILRQINATGIGPAGLGGTTTALSVHIETAACHIASLPVAVNIECHSHRHKSITL